MPNNVKILLLNKDYSDPKLKGKFDFILVDGIKREECLKSSLNLLTKNGFLMLHDCDEYTIPNGYKIIKKDNRTVLLKKIQQS